MKQPMSTLELRQVKKSFGSVDVIKGVDLAIEQGELVVFVGPSGCGKSTLLRLMAGLESVSSGQVLIQGQNHTDSPPYDRGLSMVFQSYALYPHMSVWDNIAFGLKTQGMARQAIGQRVQEAARMLHLTDYLQRKPKALSGGQRQRVAIGRAIVRNPVAFLFDEPLSNLDAALRVETRLEIARLHEQLGTTMVYVTHDQVEAMTLADRMVVLRDGWIMQTDTPRALYERPANTFVAQFLGSPKMNLIDCTGLAPNQVVLAGDVRLSAQGFQVEQAHWLGVRPEHWVWCQPEEAHLQGTVVHWEYLGADASLHVKPMHGSVITVRAPGHRMYAKGDPVHLRIDPAAMHLFDAQGVSLRC